VFNNFKELLSKYEDNPIIQGILFIIASSLGYIVFYVWLLGDTFGCEWVPEI
jgi:hypothetical protein